MSVGRGNGVKTGAASGSYRHSLEHSFHQRGAGVIEGRGHCTAGRLFRRRGVPHEPRRTPRRRWGAGECLAPDFACEGDELVTFLTLPSVPIYDPSQGRVPLRYLLFRCYTCVLASFGETVQFHTFDAAYVESLCAGDFATQEHFVRYFTELLHLKLRSRLRSPQAVEDVRQETFARVFNSLRKGGALRQPERLGAFVNTVCNNVLFEHYRQTSRSDSLDDEGQPELPATGMDALGHVAAQQLKTKVREILVDMPPRDRDLLKAVFLDERDRDEVCREFGVDREYLRVLLFRAKQEFKTEYLKRIGAGIPAKRT